MGEQTPPVREFPSLWGGTAGPARGWGVGHSGGQIAGLSQRRKRWTAPYVAEEADHSP